MGRPRDPLRCGHAAPPAGPRSRRSSRRADRRAPAGRPGRRFRCGPGGAGRRVRHCRRGARCGCGGRRPAHRRRGAGRAQPLPAEANRRREHR
ncbi:MAG: hypothetical protein DI635_15995 [Pseudoxanthomonas suwonensis]|nr:MAG: hypothetical protein DI635_15995 [Pseudoxanthomonas suwonensis]